MEKSRQPHNEQPETFIQAPIEDIENIYHLARGGVEVEYGGFSGRPLALFAAIDLERLGHADAPDWCNQMVFEGYERRMNDEYAAPRDIAQAANNALILRKRHYPNGLEYMALAYDRLTEDDCWDEVADGVDAKKITIAEHGTGIREDLTVTRRVLDTGLALQDAMPFERFELWKPLGAYASAIQTAVKLSPHVLIYGQEALSRYTQCVIDRTDEDLTLTVVNAVKSFVPHRYSKETAVRTAALNALADLRGWCPDDRKVRREVSKATREDIFLTGFGDRDFNEEEYRAMQRVKHGTRWDIMSAINAWYAVKEAEDRVRSMPAYMGSCALDAANKK